MAGRWAIVAGIEFTGPAVVLAQAVTPDLIGAWSEIGFTGALIVTVLAFFRGWIVTGTTLKESKAECATNLKDATAALNARIVALEGQVKEAAALSVEQSRSQAKTIDALHTAIDRLEKRP